MLGISIKSQHLSAFSFFLLACLSGREITHAQSVPETRRIYDQITLRAPIPKRFGSWDRVDRAKVEGEVKLLNASELKILIQRADGSSLERKFDSTQIELYHAAWGSSQAQRAIELFEARKYEEAIPALNEAIKSKIPRWQQQVLIARIVDSLAAVGRTKSAGVIFLNLAASEPPHFLYADMPLCWRGEEPSRELKQQAIAWLESSEPHAQLLGASWLLLDPISGVGARQAIERLVAHENAAIASYAAAQSWRLTPPPDTLAKAKDWLDSRDKMLLPLQLGPTEFLADRFSRTGAKELAAGELLRIASMHSGRYHRARSALESAEVLLRKDFPAEANSVKKWLEDLDQ